MTPRPTPEAVSVPLVLGAEARYRQKSGGSELSMGVGEQIRPIRR